MPQVVQFLGRTASEGAAFALGLATGPLLSPAIEELKNETWRLHPSKALDPGDAAEIVAEDVELRDWGANEASAHGVNGERFDALYGAVLNAPGIPQLFEAWRRNLIDDAAFEHGLRKAKFEPRWDAPLKGLKDRLLTISDLANARQQGFVDTARQHSESALQGVDSERADILFELSGLPLGVETMQQALNRGLIDRATFDQAIREGHTKTKYTDLAAALREPVLSHTTYATLHLKGWISEAEMNAGGALHGYTAEQMHDTFLAMGRPAAPGQMWTAATRGIDGPDGRPMDQAQFLKGIRQSDIRPEWGPMLWEIRYLYPSLLQLTRLVTSDAITPEQGADWARKARYAPEVVAALLQSWTQGAAATSKGLTATDLKTQYEGHAISRTTYINGLRELGYSAVAAEGKVTVGDAAKRFKSLTTLRNRARTQYVNWRQTRQATSDALRATGLTIALVNELLTDADIERELNIHTLTEPQVVKAFHKNLMDRATATERLTELGLSPADVATRLDE